MPNNKEELEIFKKEASRILGKGKFYNRFVELFQYITNILNEKDTEIEELKKQVEGLKDKLSRYQETFCTTCGIPFLADVTKELACPNCVLNEKISFIKIYDRYGLTDDLYEERKRTRSLQSKNQKLKELVEVYEKALKEAEIFTLSNLEIQKVNGLQLDIREAKKHYELIKTALAKGKQIKENEG